MIILCTFDQETETAIRECDMKFLTKQLDAKPNSNLVGDYINGACNFGAHHTLEQLLKIKHKYYGSDPLHGIVEKYIGGKPYSIVLHLSIKNHNNDCLQILFDHIKSRMYWDMCTTLVGDCITQALNAQNTGALKIALAFEKSCHTLCPAYYDTAALWWSRLENRPEPHAQILVGVLSPSLINSLVVHCLNKRTKHKQVLKALIAKCKPKKVLLLIERSQWLSHQPTHNSDIKWLHAQFVARENAVLTKAVRGAKKLALNGKRKI